jgi:hypothetical protein
MPSLGWKTDSRLDVSYGFTPVRLIITSLSSENNVLREEVVKLKQLLHSHVDCNVSIQLKQQDIIR